MSQEKILRVLGDPQPRKPFPKIKEYLREQERLARLKGKPPELPKEQEIPKSPQATPSGVEVKNSPDYWTIQEVNYRNQIISVDLSKNLLDNGNNKTQEQWVEYSKQEKAKGEFYTGDFPLYHALFKALFLTKDSSDKDKAEEARVFLEKQFKERWLMTLTRIKYMPSGKDIVIHNFGMLDKIEIPVDFLGNDEWVKDSKTPQVYNALLGTNNIQEINEIYSWITKKPAYLWKENSKPQTIDERVARFIAVSDRALLGCNGGPSGTGSSLGVRCVCEANMQKNLGGRS